MRRTVVRQREDGDLAVSEIIGYVAVLGLIMSSMSIVYFNGVPALESTEKSEKLQSVETAFGVLQSDVRDLADGNAAKRLTQINLQGDSIELSDRWRAWVNVSIVNTTSGNELCGGQFCNTSLVPIAFESEGTYILYENGAVIRGFNRSGMIHQPNWVFQRDAVIVPVVATRGRGEVAGSGVFSVRTERTESQAIVETTDTDELRMTVTVDSEWPVAWRTYLEEHGTVTQNGDKVKLVVDDLEKAIYKKTVVRANFA
jgi:hypothetical protein